MVCTQRVGSWSSRELPRGWSIAFWATSFFLLWIYRGRLETEQNKELPNAGVPVSQMWKYIYHLYIRTYVHTYIHTYIHTYLLLLISMLWHRQAIFESKGDKLSSSAESRIRTHQGLRHQIASRLNAYWQIDWAIEDQAKNLNSTARPYDQWAFSPLDPTAVWHSHLALAIYMFVVVNFDALAQASDIRIERRQVVHLCWEQDSNPSGSQTPNRQQTYIHTREGLCIIYLNMCSTLI